MKWCGAETETDSCFLRLELHVSKSDFTLSLVQPGCKREIILKFYLFARVISVRWRLRRAEGEEIHSEGPRSLQLWENGIERAKLIPGLCRDCL